MDMVLDRKSAGFCLRTLSNSLSATLSPETEMFHTAKWSRGGGRVDVVDTNAVIAGLQRDDLFCVVIEQLMTDTARYADIILPTTTQIEHLDLGIAWGHPYLSLNQPAIALAGDAFPNTEIFRRLATHMGLEGPELATATKQ